MYGAMRTRFVWKGMVQAVRQWISACHKCLLRKRQVPLQTRYNVSRSSCSYEEDLY